MSKPLISFILITLCIPALAISSPSTKCHIFALSGPPFHLAIISAQRGEKVHFYMLGNTANCRSKSICQIKPYLIKNNIVIISRQHMGLRCSAYSNPKTKKVTIGWLPNSKLKLLPKKNLKISNWIGIWKNKNSVINISRLNKNRKLLKISGETYWEGNIKSNVNTGDISFIGAPKINTLSSPSNDICQIKLTLISKKYLIVSDNNQCGGLNVTFTGVYRR